MLRNLCKALAACLLLATSSYGQNPTAAAPPATQAAQMWAATARYVYTDDPALRPVATELVATVRTGSLPEFNAGLATAVATEKTKLKGQNHLEKFAGIVTETQRQRLAPPALAASIIDQLDNNAERMGDINRKEGLDRLHQQLNDLAAGKPTPAIIALPAADSAPQAPVAAASTPNTAPAAPVAAAPAPSSLPSWLPWLTLTLAGLSLAGVVVLWNKLGNTRRDLATNRRVLETLLPKGSDTSSSTKLSTAVEQEVRRQLAKQLADWQATEPAAAAPPAPPEGVLPLAMAVAPTPRMHTQYVGEAPFNNSFPARSLSEQLGAYSMFAIESSEQQPDQGTFVVTGNLASHVRDHRSVLEPVCEYVGGYPLGSETRVVTEQPGRVQRRGADWEVTQRARVRFE